MKGQVTKDSLLTIHMYCSALYNVVELPLLGTPREKYEKNFWCCAGPLFTNQSQLSASSFNVLPVDGNIDSCEVSGTK